MKLCRYFQKITFCFLIYTIRGDTTKFCPGCDIAGVTLQNSDTLCNIADKHTIRVVSRSVELTLSRLRALKKQILNVLKGIQIKVQKISNFLKPRIA